MRSILKRILVLICVFVMTMFLGDIVMAENKNVVDDASILTETEIELLDVYIKEIKSEYSLDVVIVTTNNLDGKEPVEFADDYYDYNGYGVGSDYTGLLLLIDMSDRNIVISTAGEAISYFNDKKIDSMIDDISNHLGDGGYYSGCNVFLKDIQKYMSGEKENSSTIVLVALIAAVIASSVTCLCVVNSYKNANKISSANYVERDSIRYVKKRDSFINTHTTKTKIERSNNNGGGSSTHTSSSGTSHGGGSGKF